MSTAQSGRQQVQDALRDLTQVAEFLSSEAPLEAELLANAIWASPEKVTSSSTASSSTSSSSSSSSGLCSQNPTDATNKSNKSNNSAIAVNSNLGITAHATSESAAAARDTSSTSTSDPPSSTRGLLPDLASEPSNNLFGDYVDRTAGLAPNHSMWSTNLAAPASIEDLFGSTGSRTSSSPAEATAEALRAEAPAVAAARGASPRQPPPQQKIERQKLEVKGRGRTSSLSDGFVVSGLEPDLRPSTSNSSNSTTMTTGASLSTLLVRGYFRQEKRR